MSEDAGRTDGPDVVWDAGFKADGGGAVIDCNDPVFASTPRCQAICLEFHEDIGSPERTHVRPQRHQLSTFYPACEPYWRPGSVLWRAPRDGVWVIDTSGSEASYLAAVLNPRCVDGEDFICRNAFLPKVVSLAAGAPLLVVVDTIYADSQRRGPGNLLFNITPLVAEEEGADCLDGADNDADGLADCKDPTCASAPECTTPLCANETLPSEVPFRVEGELTVSEHMNRFHDCMGHNARERIFAWQAPRTGRVIFDASKSTFGAQMSVHRGGCVGPLAGACAAYDFYDDKAVATAVDVTAGEWLYVMLGGIADSLAFGVYGEKEHYVLELRDAQPETGDLCHDGLDNDGDGEADWNDSDCND